MRISRYLVVFLMVLALILASGCRLVNAAFSGTPAGSTVPAGSTIVTFLDVGQADSIIIQSGNSALLIDAGSNATAASLVSTIRSMGIKKFDLVVGTHPHEDHIGGMDKVIEQFGIGTIYMPKVSTDTRTFTDVLNAIKNKGLTVTGPVPGSTFSAGEAKYTILAPNSQKYDEMNNYSIVIRMIVNGRAFLFTGDTAADSEKEMLSRGYDLKSDVMKVGHHGSTSSTSVDFLRAVSPKYAIILAGQGNDFGHPHQPTLNNLTSAGAAIYRTDLNGTITFTVNNSNLTVKSER